MYTQMIDTTYKMLIKASALLAIAFLLVFFAFATPVSAADDPATPVNVTTTVNAPFVTLAWTSTVEAQYTLYRSATGQFADAVVIDALLLSSVSVDSPEINYSFIDTVATSGVTYTYWLLNKDAMQRTPFGPYAVYIPQKLFFTFVASR